ncbi:hypothetical protein [Jeotgalibacillus proteolyticus]|uniref:Uncharacterized protein n=1 Tax=Jeotgalibacillus proteolyticus TaxID=2082395 RepID=A0A2S5GFR8_9BACL|nr:hypothetical protein [Jeotgalibacillus proteolyticus]PPA71872.1 hypothetical protein C4B60_00390 [Jeotgalibacillus proteolyticus]
MALKRFALLGLGAAGYAYFKNKDNRDKATVAFNETKGKIMNLVDQAKQSMNDSENKSTDYNLEDEKMMAEGAQTSVNYFNEDQQDQDPQNKSS